jgi:chromosome segregation ATPase
VGRRGSFGFANDTLRPIRIAHGRLRPKLCLMSGATQPHDSQEDNQTEVDAAPELERLRQLVGSEELSYASLKLELWTVRDHFIGMEAELGNLRGRCRSLDRDLEVLRRELAQARDTSAPAASGGLNSNLRGKARAVRDRLA